MPYTQMASLQVSLVCSRFVQELDLTWLIMMPCTVKARMAVFADLRQANKMNYMGSQIERWLKNTRETVTKVKKVLSRKRKSVLLHVEVRGIGNNYSCVAEKAMAPHSSTLAWKIPWTEEPGRLQSMGLLRVRHD